MRALVITPEIRHALEELVAFATKPENHYHPPCDWVPGDRKGYVRTLSSYKVVFTITHAQGRSFRHLSVSVPGKDYPHPYAAFTIAAMCGFTGGQTLPRPVVTRGIESATDDITVAAGRDWAFRPDEDEHCIVIQQPLPEAH